MKQVDDISKTASNYKINGSISVVEQSPEIYFNVMRLQLI